MVETIHSVSCCGRRSFVSTHEKTPAAATMSIIDEVVHTVSLKPFFISSQRISR